MRLMMRSLSGYLKDKRIQSGLSQLDVAKVLGYSSPQFVSNWERGLVSPPLETIAVLIDLYKIPSAEVIEQILSETRAYLQGNLATPKKRKAAAKRARQ